MIFLILAEEKRLAERAVETAAPVEIDEGGLRRLFLDDFHKLLGKASAKNAPAFPQLPQRRRRLRSLPAEKIRGKQTQHSFYSLYRLDEPLQLRIDLTQRFRGL